MQRTPLRAGIKQTSPYRKKRGCPFTYSNSYIELALTLRTLFHFPLRATQGFLEGLVSLLGLKLQVSHYSQFSRRASALNIQLMKLKKKSKKLTDLVIDSTGLKIFGEGEWKVRIHGKQKRRVWRKYHVAVDPASHEVTAIELTEAKITDGQVISALLLDQKSIGKIYADGAYSYKCCLDAIAGVDGTPLIPIRGGTSLVKKEPSKGEELRNRLLKNIWQAGGTVMWKQTFGYHRRSLVETHVFRLKSILGGVLRSRKFENQQIEARLMAKILNRMTQLDMPKSVKAF